jgi:hypothetical protein
MKSLRFTLGVCMASALALIVSDNRACAQLKQGPFVTQAASRLTKLIDSANKNGYSLADNSFSIGGGWLKQSQEDWIPLYSVNLKAGTTYRFLAAGDNDAKDVDLDVQDSNGTTVVKDDKTDPTAVVTYTPKKDGKYLVRVRLYDSRESLPCVCLSVMMIKR